MRTLRRVAALKALWLAITRQRRPGGPALTTQLAAFPRMLLASLTGRYPGLTRGRLALMGLALVYIVSPVDLVPEAMFLVVGLADDALVLAWLAGAVLSETDAYLQWEGRAAPASAGQAGMHEDVVPGEVVG